MNQLNMQIVCVVWGSDYINIFKNFCLTSLEFEKYLNDFQWIVYTRGVDVNELSDLNIEIRKIDESLFDNLNTSIVIQSSVLAHHQKQSTSKYIWYLPPDTVWSKGAIERIKCDLGRDPDAVYMYYCRVNTQESLKALSTAGLLHDAATLYKINKNYIHRIHKSHNIETNYSTKWPEYYWIGDDTIQVAKVVASVPLIISSRSKLDSNNQFIDYKKANFIMYGGTDTIFCLSLTPVEKDCDWYENYSHLTPSKVANWCLIYGYAKPSNPLEDILIRWSEDGGGDISQYYINTLEKFKLEKNRLLKLRAEDFKNMIKPVYSLRHEIIEHIYLDELNPLRFNMDDKLYEGFSLMPKNTFFVKLENGELLFGLELVIMLRRFIALISGGYNLIRKMLVSVFLLPVKMIKKVFVDLVKYILKVTSSDHLSDMPGPEIDWKKYFKNQVWKLQIRLTRRLKNHV